jgi:hypothetical protein
MNSANDSWRSLSSLAELIEPRALCRVDFITECQSGALDNVLAIYRTFESVEITGRFDEELLESLPTSVKFICHNGEELLPISDEIRGLYCRSVKRLTTTLQAPATIKSTLKLARSEASSYLIRQMW